MRSSLENLRQSGVLVCRFGLILMFCAWSASCGGGAGAGSTTVTPPPTQPPPATEQLSPSDVQMLVQAAATATNQSGDIVIAVVDRLGNILGLYQPSTAPATLPGNFGVATPSNELAVSLARTGAFFSNDQAPLSSRTVRFISGIHFPPGVINSANAALYGIENTNRACSLAPGLSSTILPATLINGSSPGIGITTGKANLVDSDAEAVNPGGAPIFKNGQEVGGIGVAAADPNIAEYVAYAASAMTALNGPNSMTDGVGFPQFPAPGVVSIG